jgi:hypothetical protein
MRCRARYDERTTYDKFAKTGCFLPSAISIKLGNLNFLFQAEAVSLRKFWGTLTIATILLY